MNDAMLRGSGPPSPTSSRPRTRPGPFRVRVAVAGRMMAKRVMGKASFASLTDRTGTIQLFLQQSALGEAIENGLNRVVGRAIPRRQCGADLNHGPDAESPGRRHDLGLKLPSQGRDLGHRAQYDRRLQP